MLDKNSAVKSSNIKLYDCSNVIIFLMRNYIKLPMIYTLFHIRSQVFNFVN